MILVSVAQDNQHHLAGRLCRPVFFRGLVSLGEMTPILRRAGLAPDDASGPRNCGKSHLLSAVPVFLASDRGLFIFPSDEKRICLG